MGRLVSLFGLVAIIGIAWALSSHRRRVAPRIVIGGLALQLIVAAVMLRGPVGGLLFQGIEAAFGQVSSFVQAGSGFLFSIQPSEAEPDLPPKLTLLQTFVCGVLPTVVFFSSLMSVLYHWGVMQRIVAVMARVMQSTLRVSGVESLAAAANVFVGHTEAPLVVRPYIQKMTQSELNAMMVGGFATISGGLLAAYSQMGISAGHLVTASFISAPAALLIAKVMLPETEQPETRGTVQIKTPSKATNAIEAAAIGATDGMKLALNIAAMLIAFLALIAMVNALIGGLGMHLGFETGDGKPLWSLEASLGYLFAPLAWLMGIDPKECVQAGQLLGLKMVANEFIAYQRLGDWIQEGNISPRSQLILTYALSGFANFSAIGIQIGGIGGLVPERRSDLARLGMRAMIGGTLACCMTGCIAGILL